MPNYRGSSIVDLVRELGPDGIISIGNKYDQYMVDNFPTPAYRYVYPHRLRGQALKNQRRDISGPPGVEDDDVPLDHFMDLQLGPNEDGEPTFAPRKAHELAWALLAHRYNKDCQDLEREVLRQRRERQRYN